MKSWSTFFSRRIDVVTLLLVTCPSLPIFVAALSHQKHRAVDDLGQLVLVTNENWGVSNTLKIVLCLICIILIFKRMSSLVLRLPIVLIQFAILLVLVNDVLGPRHVVTIDVLAMSIVVSYFGLPIEPKKIATTVAVFGLAVSVLSALVAAVNPQIATLPCAYKCGPLGNLYVGLYDNENQFAIALLLTLPFVVYAWRGWGMILGVGVILGSIWVSGSRSSLYAGLAYCAAASGFYLIRRVRTSGLAARVVILALAVVGVAVPYLSSSPNAFTGRGVLWGIARNQIEKSPWLGGGSLEWPSLVSVGVVSQNAGYSPHNVWLDSIIAAGAIGTVAVVVSIVVALARARASQELWALCALVPLLVLGITERSATYYDLASTTAYFIPVLLGILLSSRRSLVAHERVLAGGLGERPKLISET